MQKTKFIFLQLLCLFLMAVPFGLNAQGRATVTVNYDDVTVLEVLKGIEKDTNYAFFYNNANIDVSRKVTVHLVNVPISKVVSTILPGYTCRLEKSKIFIIKDTHAQITSKEASNQSPVDIKGVIKDASGMPLTGASAIILSGGKSYGTIADLDGNFILTLPSDSQSETITFSFMGFQDLVLPIGDRTWFDVILKEDTELLEEVVVVGYGTTKKVNLTGSVSVIDADEVAGRTSSNTSNLLVGAVPNMNVTASTGRPGEGSMINIRGVNSISSSAGPYVLIDGVEGDIDTVNPNDIESISVLKDASSAAIYGAKAAYGVILITTKQGGDDDVHVDYNGRFTFHSPAVCTDFETRGYYSAAIADMFSVGFQGTRFTNYTDEDYYQLWIRRNDKVEHPDRPWVIERDGQYVYYANFDWFNYFFDNSRPTNEHNVSVYGGNKKLNYRISAGYYHQDGVIKQGSGDSYTRYNMRARISSQVNDWLRISNNTSYFKDKYPFNTLGKVNEVWFGTALYGLASIPATNPDGSAIWVVNNYSAQGCHLVQGHSAVLEYDKTRHEDASSNISTTFEVVLTPIKDLRIVGDYTYSHKMSRTINRPLRVPYSRTPGVIETVGDLKDRLSESRGDAETSTANLYANYNHTFAGAHNLAVTAGAFYNTRYSYNFSATRTGLISEELIDFELAKGEEMTIGGGKSRYINQGLFYRVGYDYKGKYLFELNGRYDGSSRFPKGIRYGFFPSVSAGWRMSEEPWFAPVKKVISNLKIRASYGKLGNNEVSDYGYIQTINSGDSISYAFGGSSLASGASISAPNASDYSWEVVTSSNIGLDFSLFENRLNFSGDAYIRDTDGMFMAMASLPNVYGAAEPKSNAASLRSKGWEFMIEWKDGFMLGGKPFNYSVGGSLADYTSKVLHYNNENHTLGTPYSGQTLGEIWGFVVDGFFESDEEAANYIVDQTYVNSIINTSVVDNGLHAGDLKFADMDGKLVNGRPVIEPTTSAKDIKDMVVIGNSLPRYTYTLRMSASWMGFDLSMLFNGVGRQHWYPGKDTGLFWGPYGRPAQTYVPSDFLEKVWREDNPDSYFPRPRSFIALSSSNDRALAAVNNRYLQNVGYFRLKNLTFGYTLPQKLTRKINVDKVRLYFSGENLFTVSPLESKYIDPAMVGGNLSWQTGKVSVYGYPTAKSYSFGLDITF